MKNTMLWMVALFALLALLAPLGRPLHAQNIDSSPHSVQFVTVDHNVKLEVLDWGGSGRALVFIPGLGATAHTFDQFAPKLTAAYHVYGITRRGFGASSAPVPTDDNYTADRLGDDVLAVIDALKLNRPVLVGHSLGGEELSSVGSRHPEKVAGLVYLDAGYAYAFYDRARGDVAIDSIALRKMLQQLIPGYGPNDQRALIQQLLSTLPQFEKELQRELEVQEAGPRSEVRPNLPPANPAILAGEQKYTDIRVPVLAIFALPHNWGTIVENADDQAAADDADVAYYGPQVDAFEKGVPNARVVRIPYASHGIYRSNEEDVLREMNAFLKALP
jgi:non-heme chloroperoxidase